MKIIKWLAGGSIAAALVLMGNIEQGTAGTWANRALAVLVVIWTGFCCALYWYEREEKRMQERENRKAIARAEDAESKRKFIRKTMAA